MKLEENVKATVDLPKRDHRVARGPVLSPVPTMRRRPLLRSGRFARPEVRTAMRRALRRPQAVGSPAKALHRSSQELRGCFRRIVELRRTSLG